LWLFAGGPSALCERSAINHQQMETHEANAPSKGGMRLVGPSVGDLTGLMVTRIDRFAAASATCRTWCAK
jgi:hypothetical protein